MIFSRIASLQNGYLEVGRDYTGKLSQPSQKPPHEPGLRIERQAKRSVPADPHIFRCRSRLLQSVSFHRRRKSLQIQAEGNGHSRENREFMTTSMPLLPHLLRRLSVA